MNNVVKTVIASVAASLITAIITTIVAGTWTEGHKFLTKIKNLESQIEDIKSEALSIQMGEASPPQGKLKGGYGRKESKICPTFNEPFKEKPTIKAGFTKLDVSVSKDVQRIELSVKEVTKTKFCIYFQTWEENQVFDVRAFWIAVGKKN